MRPRDPVPLELQATVEYSDENGDAFTGGLPALELAFWDMMLPIQWPTADGSGNVEVLFQTVWEHLRAGKAATGVADHMESVLRLTPADDGRFEEEKVLAVLGRFCVRAYRLPNRSLHLLAGIMYLPGHQILLKADLHPGHLAFRIVTDNSKALPFVEEHLRTALC